MEDIRVYSHCNIEELGNAQMLKLYIDHMIDRMGNLKPEFKMLEEKGFTQFVNFSDFDEPEWVRYILSKIHDKFMWLDKPHEITKTIIKVVTCLNSTGEVTSLRNVKNQIVTKVIGSQFDKRAMTISDIIEHDVIFASMVTGYKVYQSSPNNSVSGTTIYVAYQILKEDKLYDPCEVLQSEILRNIKKIKQDKKHVFKFDTLIICLYFYSMNEILGVGKVQWTYDMLVDVQIKETLKSLGNSQAQKGILWGYFKTFQSMMQNRERIPKEIVEKYQDTIHFMVETGQCLMEFVELRTSWIMPMGYEVKGHVLEAYAQHLLSK